LDVPQVHVWPAELDGNLLLHRVDREAPEALPEAESGPVELPDELYLRELMELDLTDERAILGFVNDYGPLGDSFAPFLYLPTWLSPFLAPDYDPDFLMPVEEQWIMREKQMFFVLQKVEAFKAHAWCLRDAVRLWQVQTGQMSLEELSETWELVAMQEKVPKDADECLDVLASILNAALQPFHARMDVLNSESFLSHTRLPNLYCALCLQFFNHVVEEAVYIRCHNETCSHLFVRQRGRAKQGKYHTTGVKYCSDYCARAQGQRELRRRKAKKPGRREEV